MKKIYRVSEVILLILSILSIHSCKKEAVPALTTSDVTNITATTASCGGKITSEGSGTVTSRGICWSTYTVPTIAENKTTDGAGAGSFSSIMTGLDGATIYYVRAYATNTAGIGYGATLSFTTLIDRESVEKEAIQNYINNNPNLTFKLKPSGLYYLDVITGNGASPVAHDTAYIKYTGGFLDGTVFGSNVSDTSSFCFVVGEGIVLSGIDEGVTYMKEGGKAKMLIPSTLAYGSYGYMNIPGYTPLLFDIELVKVKKGP